MRHYIFVTSLLALSACAVQPLTTTSTLSFPSIKAVELKGDPETAALVESALSRLGWATRQLGTPIMRYAFSEREGEVAIWDENQTQAIMISAPRARRWYEGCTTRKLRFSFAIDGRERGASEMTACRFLPEDYESLVIAAVNPEAATAAGGS